MNYKMIKFTLYCDNGYSECGIREDFEVAEKDLEGIPKNEWQDHVWNKLGGKEIIYDQLDMGCFESEE